MMNKFYMTLILSLLFFVSIVASAKTLPKGVLAANLSYEFYEMNKVGLNLSGDQRTWASKLLRDLSLADVKMLTDAKILYDGPVEAIFIDPDLNQDLTEEEKSFPAFDYTGSLGEYWKTKKVYFNLAYGFSDKLTGFLAMSYEHSILKLTDETVEQTRLLNAKFEAADTIIGPVYDDSFDAMPKEGKGSGFNDIFIGASYHMTDHFSVGYKGSFGFLRIGTDAREKKLGDGVLELETGQSYDEHQFVAFYDLMTPIFPLELIVTYVNKGKGYQHFLDNQHLEVDFGDTLGFSVGTEVELLKKLTGALRYTSLNVRNDQYRFGNSKSTKEGYADWTDVPVSSVKAEFLGIKLTYVHKLFLHSFVDINILLSNDKQGQIYDFPGRLEPGTMVNVGMTLFYKKQTK